MPATDPIEELVRALEAHGKPPLPWVVRWSAGEQEPVRSAWQHSRSALRMMSVLGRVGRDETEALFRALVAHVEWWDSPLSGVSAQVEASAAARLAEAVRRGAPDPPGLAELMAAFARRGPRPAGALTCVQAVPRLERGEWPAGWIVQRAAFGEVPLRDEWRLAPTALRVRVLAYAEPGPLAVAFGELQRAAQARTAALAGYAGEIEACAGWLRAGAARRAADAFQRASAAAWQSAARSDMDAIEGPWADKLATRLQPSVAALLAGIDRARTGDHARTPGG